MKAEPVFSSRLKRRIAAAGERGRIFIGTARAAAHRIPLLLLLFKTIRGAGRKVFTRVRKKRWYIEMSRGKKPGFFPPRDSNRLQLPDEGLIAEIRRFWFNNQAGGLEVGGRVITRRDIEVHGGPNPFLIDPLSQRMEWLSRIAQTDLYEPHDSPQSEPCRVLCGRQGDELWTHFHQNFDFAVGNDAALAAPKCLCIFPNYRRFLTPQCDHWMLVLKRRMARACQVDLVTYPADVDWAGYDLAFLPLTGRNLKFRRPDIPVLLYGHDMWPEDEGFQWVIDWLEPDVLLTTSPTPWIENFRMPPRTRVAFSPFAPSMFFSRPNPDPDKKRLDLLVIGSLSHPVYAPRVELDRQIRALGGSYRVEFSHFPGYRRFRYGFDVPTLHQSEEGPVRYLNQWSAYLGSARYVIFGRVATRTHGFILSKYYEALASGAIPIFPEVPDLALLGLSPFEHYVPLSEVEGDNRRLAHFLDRYEAYFPIARNAVAWSEANMDRLLFDDFEAVIHEVTGRRFPGRLTE